MGKRSALGDIILSAFLILLVFIYKWVLSMGGHYLIAIVCLFLFGVVLGWNYFISRILSLGRIGYDFRRLFIVGLPLILFYLLPLVSNLKILTWPGFFLNFCQYLNSGREFYAPIILIALGYIFITGFYKKEW